MISRNLWFSVKESGVGGSLVDVPTASSGLGGEYERRVRRWLFIEPSFGKTYCVPVNK